MSSLPAQLCIRPATTQSQAQGGCASTTEQSIARVVRIAESGGCGPIGRANRKVGSIIDQSSDLDQVEQGRRVD